MPKTLIKATYSNGQFGEGRNPILTTRATCYLRVLIFSYFYFLEIKIRLDGRLVAYTHMRSYL